MTATATAQGVPPRLAQLAGVAAALLARLLVSRLRFDRVIALTHRLARRAHHPATAAQTRRALHAVDAGATLLPVRVACLERSLAALLLLALAGRGVTLSIGVRTPPVALHAWLADPAGRPIAEPDSTAAYRPLVTVPFPPIQTGVIT